MIVLRLITERLACRSMWRESMKEGLWSLQVIVRILLSPATTKAITPLKGGYEPIARRGCVNFLLWFWCLMACGVFGSSKFCRSRGQSRMGNREQALPVTVLAHRPILVPFSSPDPAGGGPSLPLPCRLRIFLLVGLERLPVEGPIL